MTITTMSSREVNQNAGGARRAAQNGPATSTDRGRPSHVLLRFNAYCKHAVASRRLLGIVA